jgi:hypothetical protein
MKDGTSELTSAKQMLTQYPLQKRPSWRQITHPILLPPRLFTSDVSGNVEDDWLGVAFDTGNLSCACVNGSHLWVDPRLPLRRIQ